MATTEPKWAYYSKTMEDHTGAMLYRGVNGKNVICTVVTRSEGHNTKHDDITFVGMVDEMLKRVGWGALGKPNHVDT